MIRPVGGGAERGALGTAGEEAGDQGRVAGSGHEAIEQAGRAGELAAPSAGPVEEDGAPVGPSEGEETAFLAEQRAIEPESVPRRNGVAAPADEPAGPLPPLEDLVERIPAPTRALLDELFRAKFVTVKRVPKEALK